MDMKIVKESLNKLPTWGELVSSAPKEIQDILQKCEETPQSSIWHPEASDAKVPHNVLAHTRLVFDRTREYNDINLLISALFHDLGKPSTLSVNKQGKYSNHGHERVSANLVDRHRAWVGSLGAKFMQVKEIVDNHMKIKMIEEMRPHKQEALRNLRTYSELEKFTKCDDMRTLTDEELNRYK